MRPTRLTLAAVAVLAAGTTAYLARHWVDAQHGAAIPAPQPLAEVLVAARDLPPGTVIQADDLRFDSWPAATAARLTTRRDGEDVRARFAGQISRRDLSEGEPVTAQSVRRNSAGMLAGMLGADMRAVSIAITNTSAAAGFVTPGDRVDVMLAADLVRTAGGAVPQSGPLVRYAAETVLSGVKVLAIDQSTTRSRDGGAVEGKTATLEVTSRQAQTLAAAAMLGSLSLALRGLETGDASVPAPSFVADTEASQALKAMQGARARTAPAQSGAQVTVNRAGQITAQTFGR
jgi:pilus assembly protein CpaB